MSNPENFSQPEKRKPKAWLNFGLNGHEKEYVFVMGGIDIPPDVEESIQTELGEEWELMNRGTRIEIRNRQEYGRRDDERVGSACRVALGDAFEFVGD